MDLSSACVHSLILDIDYKKTSSVKNFTTTFNLIESVLKSMFLPNVPNFTYIIALRLGGKGIHIHLPEFKIGHDDYIILCESLQYRFKQAMLYNEGFELDILANAMLPGASKPNCKAYIPTRVVYVDERNKFFMDVWKLEEAVLLNLRKTFVKRRDNEKSIFRELLNYTPSLVLVRLKYYMMPVIEAVSTHHALMYATNIGHCCNNSSDWEDVATFIYKKSNESGFVRKSKTLVFNNANLLKAYHYLKLNARAIRDFTSNNRAISLWYKRFCENSPIDPVSSHIPEKFRELHEMLQYEHASLAKDPNPIKTVIQFNDGYYFLPVFYSMCQYYKTDSSAMAESLYSLLDEPFHKLLDKIREIQPKIINFEISDISINTLHFCANNLYRERPKNHREKLKSIVRNNVRTILSVTTEDQMVFLIRSIQDRHLPIRVLRLKNGLKKPCRYIWNALDETWQEITLPGEISDHITNLFNNIKQFVKEYHASGGVGGPDDDFLNKFSVHSVISAINSDTSMERKEIQMDSHKWFLRLQDGVLDLLTGHIGGVVPEFFLSDRKINQAILRRETMSIFDDSSRKYSLLYETLTDKRFFFKYLQNLFSDATDNLFDALYNLVLDDGDELSKSMLHFYINLCKCMSFEYEMIMYMLDILASVYIGTNYERKFFVWKGLTRNGKSKLFELMGRVLGSYYHSIQSENLAPGHSANNATPELASTLFSCRMVTVEELGKRIDENRVKQITGDSFVTFRNMYEQNSGGIPTAKVFASTNNYPECIASEAFKDRVVAIPFDAEFSNVAPEQTSEQVSSNTYLKDVYVTEQSYKGCFFMLYYHLKKHMSLNDGLLHYRDQPEYVTEFTNEYLLHADVYVQFKLYMDVQLMPGTMTTMNDLKSAVRQYLKTTKNTSQPECNLVICFEKEFGHLRRNDINLKSESFSYTSVLDEEEGGEESVVVEGLGRRGKDEPPLKMAKQDDSVLVYFEGVVIKNMKRINLD